MESKGLTLEEMLKIGKKVVHWEKDSSDCYLGCSGGIHIKLNREYIPLPREGFQITITISASINGNELGQDYYIEKSEDGYETNIGSKKIETLYYTKIS